MRTVAAATLGLCALFLPAGLLPAHAASTRSTPALVSETAGPSLRRAPFTLTEADRGWWSFQPVRRPPVPGVHPRGRVANPIDAFLLARLETNGLALNPPATRRELIRRACSDLIGLPPPPEEVQAFESDPSPEAWPRLIDRLLARPQYGERWARHWLDLVRYAESNGYERDGAKPHAWRYRDYVIRSFNQDKPYDRFIVEQLAGDQLPGGFDPDAIVATGFYRLHVWDDEPDSTLTAEFDDLDDIMVTTGATFLGLTIGCARCHDHKFDPVSQADYYRMLAFVRSLNPYGQPHTGGGGRGTGNITRPLAPPQEVAAWESAHQARLKQARDDVAASPQTEARRKLEETLKGIEAEAAPYEFALAANDDAVRPTHVFHRGDVHSPGEEVQPGFLSILNGGPAGIEPTPTNQVPRRLALARWLARHEHPLTARVLVNRLWQHHFGRGLVRTPNDFGRTGEPPTHPELLDYLAAEFTDGDWQIKRMHRLIMTSRAYQMSSRAPPGPGRSRDESNVLFWRQNPRRAEAEVLRDGVLAISGELNLRMGGPSVFPTLPREVHTTQDAAGKGWSDSPPIEQNRRTIYGFIKRALIPPLLDAYDYNTTTVPVGSRAVTTVAPQALMLLNDAFMQAQAQHLAERLRHEAGPDQTAQVRRAFALAVQRAPGPQELQAAISMLREQRRLASGDAAAALQAFCVAMLNLNEVLYTD